MKCDSLDFTRTLRFECPGHGGWGLVRMCALFPEVHMLFVIPPACGRHGALGAVKADCKNSVSYLYFTEAEIVSGKYLDAIFPAVDELLERFKPCPKAVALFGGCIDDLLGTDFDSVIEQLEIRHPDTRFAYAHMDPIKLDSSRAPGITFYLNLFKMLKTPSRKLRRVNFLGNNRAPLAGCELYRIIESYGLEICQIPGSTRFEQFVDMGDASLNILLTPRAVLAAKDMKRRLGIPYVTFYPSYDLDDIQQNYIRLTDALNSITGQELSFDLEKERKRAEEAYGKLKEVLGEIPVAMDSAATLAPFSMAKGLMKAGIGVEAVVTDALPGFENESWEYLKQSCPDLKVIDPSRMEYSTAEGRAGFQTPGVLCIGVESAWIMGAERVINVQDDDDMAGYAGVVKLCERLAEGAEHRKIIEDEIREANLVV